MRSHIYGVPNTYVKHEIEVLWLNFLNKSECACASGMEYIWTMSNKNGPWIELSCICAGGLGINLTAANTVILHDLDFNPYNDKQVPINK